MDSTRARDQGGSMSLDEYLNSLRGRKTTQSEFQRVLAIAITVNRYAQLPWYKKIRRFK